MEFSIKISSPEKAKTSCLVAGIFESGDLCETAACIDLASHGFVQEIVRSGDMQGKSGTCRLLYRIPGIRSERVLLVGLGKKEAFGAKEYCDAVRTSISALNETGTRDAWIFFAELPVIERSSEWKARHLVLAASEALYHFDQMKSAKVSRNRLAALALGLHTPADRASFEHGISDGKAISAGVNLAKDLGNLPGNVCTPGYLALAAEKLSREFRVAVDILDRKEMERLKMGAMLSVANGSRQAPKFIVMRHDGASKKERPVVLIGKGITFDTGGISIKPAGEMDEMKFDMCGGAAVIGTMRAIAEMKLPLNVVGIVPATENMPGGAATKPGDIVTSMSGQTIEILNTDAEGRLILCDALTYAERFQPAAVIDVATLTGACIIALGHVCTGLFSNSENLARELLAAGENSWDRAWRLPIWDEYQDQLKSNFADFANIGGRPAGSVTAACFLSRFAKSFEWAHLDIAGVAWRSGKDKGSTGRPIPMLTNFLIEKAKSRVHQ